MKRPEGDPPISPGTNPGQGPGTGANLIKPMGNYEADAQVKVDNFRRAKEENKLDTKLVTTHAELEANEKFTAFLDINKLEKDYKLDEEFKAGPGYRDFPELKIFNKDELGFDMSAPKQMMRVVVTNGGQTGTKPTINKGTYDKNGEFMILEEAFKINDEKRKVPINEIGYQAYAKTAGENTKNLKGMFLMDVQNKEFWAITRTNYNEAGYNFDQVVTFKRGTPAETAQFERFLGSPNINSKFNSLTNHHGATGGREPTKIIIVPKQAKRADDTPNGKLTAALVFE